jgi:hypothetical protein
MMARLHSWVANDTAKSLGGNVTTKVVQKPLASREPQTQQVCARTSSPILCLSLITSRKNVFRTHIFKTTNSDLKPENKIQIGFDFILIKYTTGTLGKSEETSNKNPHRNSKSCMFFGIAWELLFKNEFFKKTHFRFIATDIAFGDPVPKAGCMVYVARTHGSSRVFVTLRGIACRNSF